MAVNTNDQIWFFLRENLHMTDFTQGYQSKADFFEMGPSFETILQLARAEKSKADDYDFYLHSSSMKAAVQILSDEAITVTWSLYCQHDPVVTVHVRSKDDPSPNSTRTPSHSASLAQRRQVSRSKIPEVMLRGPLRHVSHDLDVATLAPIQDLPDSDKVVLDLGMGQAETLSKEYLLGWIEAEVSNGKDITDIIVTTMTPRNRPKEFTLTQDVWITSLLRGPWKTEFQHIWEARKRITAQRNLALTDLRQVQGFELSAKRFIRDLMLFGRDKNSQDRLQNTQHEFYLGKPYFDSGTVAKILKLPVGTTDLDGELRKLAKRKTDRREGDELCASHDLAPLFQVAFGIEWKIIKNENLLVEMGNLRLGVEGAGGKKGGDGAGGLKKSASKFFNKTIGKAADKKRTGDEN